MDHRPIGVFDSGLGGLTAAGTLRRLLPGEDIIYFGDSGHVPYGTKTRDELFKIARHNIEFLTGFGVKAILIACGTISTNILDALAEEYELPIRGVLHPAAEAAADATKTGVIGIIATPAAIKSGAFAATARLRRGGLKTVSVSCPKFAPLVESGHFGREDPAVTAAVREYLGPVDREDIDTLVLGCTHYSLLVPAISDYLGRDVFIVDAGERAAVSLAARLERDGMLKDGGSAGSAGSEVFYTSGDTRLFAKSTELFLRRSVERDVKYVAPMPLD